MCREGVLSVTGNQMLIIDQFRECLKDMPLGTRMKRQEIIDLVHEKFGTNPSSIIPSDYCYNMMNQGISDHHAAFFLNVGTGLYEYVGEGYRRPTIEDVISAYKADFPRRDDEERYKWEVISRYKKHWNIETEDFAGMLREALRWAGEKYKRPRDGKQDGGNLLTSSMYYPYKMICAFALQEPETVRKLFRILLDESRPLSLRYTEFRDGCDKCLERYRNSDPSRRKANNHYQDLRAISVYLAFEYPEKYYLYKYTMYKDFANLLGFQSVRQTTQGSKAELALTEYSKLCEKVLEAVQKDAGLREMSKARLDEACYQDPAFHLLTMDIIYYGSQLAQEEACKVSGILSGQGSSRVDTGKNTILYGPPGTGKTYHTVIYAVAIIENKPLAEIQSEPYENVIKRYGGYKADGLIEFTTFHQSYGYEEFIEGIRPIMEQGDEDAKGIEYEIAPGVFKSFCDRASQPIAKQDRQGFGLNDAPVVWKVSLWGTGENPVRTECMENNHIRIGWDGYGEMITDETEYSDGGRNVLNAFINRMKVGDLVFSCYSSTTADAIGVVTGEYEWHDEYEELKRLRQVKWLVKGIYEDITTLNGATMTLASVYRLNISAADAMALVLKHFKGQPKAQPNGNYVFVIDEINRGNISKIFGELITLMEPLKRIGQPEGTTVKLPYSQKPFGIPDNVYLIGTMNTADRSIATIDTALRRRFRFREMQPDPKVLEGVSVEDISIKELLERMNKKITVLYDREHTIGHGYFMPLKDNPAIEQLADIFENQIIPLLQAYFYDDYEKIRLVLGDNNKDTQAEQFIIARSVNCPELFGNTDMDLEEAFSYEINRAAFDNIDAYRSI